MSAARGLGGGLGYAEGDHGWDQDRGRFVEVHYCLGAGEEGHVGWEEGGVVGRRCVEKVGRALFAGLFFVCLSGRFVMGRRYGRALSLRRRNASGMDCFGLCMCFRYHLYLL